MALTDMVPTACGESCNGVVFIFAYAEKVRFNPSRKVEMRSRNRTQSLGLFLGCGPFVPAANDANSRTPTVKSSCLYSTL